MPDVSIIIALAAVGVACWAARGWFDRYSTPEAVKARLLSRVLADIKSLEALKPDTASAAAAQAGEAAQIIEIKAEVGAL